MRWYSSMAGSWAGPPCLDIAQTLFGIRIDSLYLYDYKKREGDRHVHAYRIYNELNAYTHTHNIHTIYTHAHILYTHAYTRKCTPGPPSKGRVQFKRHRTARITAQKNHFNTWAQGIKCKWHEIKGLSWKNIITELTGDRFRDPKIWWCWCLDDDDDNDDE